MADTFGALTLPARVPNVKPAPWAPGAPYTAASIATPITPTGFYFRPTGSGTSGAVEPVWPTAVGATIGDNGLVWTCLGVSPTVGTTSAPDVAGDPLLQVLLSYLRAGLPRMLGDAWAAPGVAPGRGLVPHAFAWDPSSNGFVSAKLPALYAWREGDVTTTWLAADYVLDVSRVTLLYVFEPHADPEVVKARAPFANAIRKAVIQLIEAERDPAWVVVADTIATSPTYDATAATLGSVMSRWAGFFDLNVGKGRSSMLRVPGAEGTPPEFFRTFEIELQVRERQTADVATDFDALMGLDATYEVVQVDADPSPLVIGEEIST